MNLLKCKVIYSCSELTSQPILCTRNVKIGPNFQMKDEVIRSAFWHRYIIALAQYSQAHVN